MNDNVLIHNGPDANQAPASLPGGAYKLDWQDFEIKLAKGRFSHTLRRPTPEQITAREKEIETEIPIARDGSFSIPDPTATEEVDARLHDELLISSSGYTGEIPTRHKAAAFQAIYRREIDLEEGADIFGDEITVVEEIGGSDEPDFVVQHVMRQPTESEIRKFRARSAGGEVKPGKRGKQRFVSRSNLSLAIQIYDATLVRIDGATVEDKAFTDAERPAFLHAVDPLIKRRIVQVLIEKLNEGLLD